MQTFLLRQRLTAEARGPLPTAIPLFGFLRGVHVSNLWAMAIKLHSISERDLSGLGGRTDSMRLSLENLHEVQVFSTCVAIATSEGANWSILVARTDPFRANPAEIS
jgi:hypothetical protein